MLKVANSVINASRITGVLPVVNGGTGVTTSTGTGNTVLATSPSLVTPNIGDATGTQLNIDNLRLDGNIISSTDTNGIIDLTPAGTGKVRVTNSLQFRSNNLGSNGRLAAYYVASISTTPVAISEFDGTWGHLAIVVGLSTTGGNFFTDLVFSSATAGPTVLSAKSISGSPAARTYSMSGSSILQLAMASSTYEVSSSIMFGLS